MWCSSSFTFYRHTDTLAFAVHTRAEIHIRRTLAGVLLHNTRVIFRTRNRLKARNVKCRATSSDEREMKIHSEECPAHGSHLIGLCFLGMHGTYGAWVDRVDAFTHSASIGARLFTSSAIRGTLWTSCQGTDSRVVNGPRTMV